MFDQTTWLLKFVHDQIDEIIDREKCPPTIPKNVVNWKKSSEKNSSTEKKVPCHHYFFFQRLAPTGALLFITILLTEHINTQWFKKNFLPPQGFEPGWLGSVSRWLINYATVYLFSGAILSKLFTPTLNDFFFQGFQGVCYASANF